MIKGVLFDMDGVLIDAKDWHYEALNRALDLFGMAIDRDAHLATFDGLPTRKKLELLSNSRGLPVKLHSFLNDIKQRYTTEIAYAQCRPVFHLQYGLARLRRENYRLAVCSNSVRHTVDLLMDLSALRPFLDIILSNQDVERAKPAPDIYLEAMRRLSLSPDECLIVEDNDHGIQAAKASGGHILEVATIHDVTYERIMATIKQADGRGR